MYRTEEERIKYTPQMKKYPPVRPDFLDHLSATERAAGFETANVHAVDMHGTATQEDRRFIVAHERFGGEEYLSQICRVMVLYDNGELLCRDRDCAGYRGILSPEPIRCTHIQAVWEYIRTKGLSHSTVKEAILQEAGSSD